MNQVIIENLKVEIDSHIHDVQRLLGNLILDYDVQRAAKVKNRFSIPDQELLYALYQNIQAKFITTNFLDDIFIYFNNTGTIISINGHMGSLQFYELYYQNPSLNYYDFISLFSQTWNRDILYLDNNKGQTEVLFLKTLLPLGTNDNIATIGVVLHEETILEWLKSVNGNVSTDYYIITKDNHIIGNQLISDMNSVLTFDIQSNTDIIKIGNKSYTLSVIPSESTAWKYIALTSSSLLWDSAGKIQKFTIIGLIICITLGVITAYFLTRLNYNPLRRIVDLFQKQQPDIAKKQKNEYQWLISQTNKFFMEHKEAKLTIINSQKIIRNNYLYRLITKSFEEKNDIPYLQKYKISLPNPWNVVILFTSKPMDDKNEKPVIEVGLSKFILSNIFEEMISEYYTVESVDMGDVVVFIINCPNNTHEVSEQLESVIYNTQKLILEQFHLCVSAFAGSFSRGFDGVHDSYLCAREAYEYQELLNDPNIVWYNDIKNHWITYEYSLETEQKIINAIKIGNANAANEWISFVLKKNYENKSMASMVRNCLLFDLAGTIMKGADLGGGTEFIFERDLEQSLSSKLTLTEVEELFHSLVVNLCQHICEKELESRNDHQFSHKVMDFVNENYSNPDLNISITAMNFNITPAYLSALFKEQVGTSLLEYINNTRIDKVKELLNENYSISDIATMTGFRNSGSLIRVFKKVTGITPGQMKKLLK